MNTKYIKYLFWFITALLIGSITIASTYALSDSDFRSSLLKQVKIDMNLSDAELKEIETELQDISFQDVLDFLGEEISSIVDKGLRSEIQEDYKKLVTIQDGDTFIQELETVYSRLDDHYESEGAIIEFDEVMPENGQVFEMSLEETLWYLKEEVKYIKDNNVSNKLNVIIMSLESEKDDKVFEDKLNEAFDILDDFYHSEAWAQHYKENKNNPALNVTTTSYIVFDEDGLPMWAEDIEDFDQMRDMIINGLKQEKSFIEDKDIQKEIDNVITKLNKTKDEKVFFNTLDSFYESQAMENYYNNQWVQIMSFDWFEAEEFDFDTEKKFILDSLKSEIDQIKDKSLQSKIEKEVVSLEPIEEADKFFQKLDTIYRQLDTHFGYTSVESFTINEEELEGMTELEIKQYIEEEHGFNEAIDVDGVQSFILDSDDIQGMNHQELKDYIAEEHGIKNADVDFNTKYRTEENHDVIY